ncbi:MAG TPA: DinB family protein [Catalimonadaceae bacterium]|jgi:hypothetical protein|nr:DinB family protein [Catalimonadaceae bacterium]
MIQNFSHKIGQPEASEYPASLSNYISEVTHPELLSALAESHQHSLAFWESIPEEKRLYRYADNKWTIQDLIQHLMDAERIFAYRALRFARKDQTVLSPFEENDYAETSGANQRPWADLVREYDSLRQSTIYLFNSFPQEVLTLKGQSGSNFISVRALGFAILGHELHHLKVIRERYLS